MPRRVSLVVFLGLVAVVVLATGIPAGAAPGDNVQAKQAEIQAAQARLTELNTQASASYEAYNNALFELNQLSEKIQSAEADLSVAQKRLVLAQGDLDMRASQVYMSGNVAFLDVLVGSESFTDFATRLELWLRLIRDEQATLQSVRAAQEELQAKKQTLESRRSQRAETVEAAASQREEASEAAQEAEAYLDSLNGELQALVQAEQQRQAEQARAAAAAAIQNAPELEQVAQETPGPRQVATATLDAAEEDPVAAPEPEIEQAAAERATEQAATDEYAAGQAATEQYESEPAPAPEESAPAPSSGSGSAVVAEAQTWLGVPYVYGGTSRSGVDCSGLTMMVFAEFGISLPHSAAGQYGYGTAVSTPAPGDLVFFGSGGITSVGIVTGPDQAIKATVPGDVVRYVSISEVGNAVGLVGYKRLL